MANRRTRAMLLAGALWLLGPFEIGALAQPLVAPGEALSPAEEQGRFHLPPGFEIQLFASEPAIHKPMNLTFDSAGRLFVTDTLEYPYPAKEGSTPRDTVKILLDRDGDGAADDVTTFVDGLNIPLGVMPIPGGVIVYGINSVMRCLDVDGDGKADTRQPLYGNFGSRDTHGMVNSFTRGLDGWLYACHGFSNDSAPQGADGQAIRMNSGNTFRMRLDGSHLEYFTHGQVNPFGLAFDPLGNLYSADCHTMPIYMLLRGAYYPSFGKAHDGLGFGPTMIGHNHGSSGIGGIAYYAAEHFPSEYRDTILVGNPVTGRVNHDRLVAQGSTYQCVELPDFVTCDDPWFRPVNLHVGPDGALYIADFYNRIIGHYEVPLEHPGRDRQRGRIWRVIYTGKGVDKPPRTLAAQNPHVERASVARLIELVDDANLTTRTLATHELVDRAGGAAVEPLKRLLASTDSTPRARVHGMWALERLVGLDEHSVTLLARDADRTVRTHLFKLLAERSKIDLTLVRAALADQDAFVRRAAADALARHVDSENIGPLLRLWRETPADDTHLIHVARMALRDQLAEEGAYAGVEMARHAPSELEQLADVSLGLASGESAAFVWRHLRQLNSNHEAYVHHVVRYVDAQALDAVFDELLSRASTPRNEQILTLRAVGRAARERGILLPPAISAWSTRLAGELLASVQEGDVRAGIELAREFRAPLFDVLSRLARPETPFGGLRPAALEACIASDGQRAIELLAGIMSAASEPMDLRQNAATALARLNNDAARNHLCASLQTAPERLAVQIAAALCDSDAGAAALLDAVESGKASPRLLQERGVVQRLESRKLPVAKERLARLTTGLGPPDARVRELLERRRTMVAGIHGDARRGAAVFEKHCAICHRIGDRGAKIGPNLDGIGIRGVDRLLEDVLDPNRNVDQAFRITNVVTTDGRIVSGLVLREEGQVLVMADAQGKEQRLNLEQIEERAIAPLSPMPANVPDLLSDTEFVDLIGYLLSQREAAPLNPPGAH